MDKPSYNARSTKIEVDLRIDYIVELLIKGYKRREILQFATKQNWELTDRQVDSYMQKARDRIKTLEPKDIEYKINLSLARLEEIFRLSLNDKEYQAAIRALKEQHDLLGLYAPSRTEIQVMDSTWFKGDESNGKEAQ